MKEEDVLKDLSIVNYKIKFMKKIGMFAKC